MRYRVIAISEWTNRELPRIAELENLGDKSYGRKFKVYLFPHVENMVTAIGFKEDYTLSGFYTLLETDNGSSLENITEGSTLRFPF